MGPLLFLIYINDLADGLSSNAKLFPDDTSLFSVVHDVDTSANELNNDLYQINKWAFQWKMNFNPDPSKQAHEIIFSRKTKKICHPSLRFNNSIVSQSPYRFNNSIVSQSLCQKHLGIFLDSRLTFQEHLKVITTKVNKTIGLLRKLQKILPRPVLTILTGKDWCFTQFSTEMAGWLLLIFLICLHKQLNSVHSIISTDV